jgi:putative membrane protein
MGPVFFHDGAPLGPHDLWAAWDFAPGLLVPLVLTVLIYLWGVRNAWKSAGSGHGIPTRSVLSFSGGILVLFVALVSPLDALSGVLFSAHMAQHMLLILLAAPLLVMSDIPVAMLWALPRRWAHWIGQGINRLQPLVRAWRAITRPVSAWLLFAIFFWAWHVPRLFQAALENERVHALEHLVFLATGMLYWWVLLRDSSSKRVRYGMAVPYLFTTILHTGVLSALITFASRPWYPFYSGLVAPWGLTLLQDQQLAGVIMWVPGGTVYSLLAIAYFAAWLRTFEPDSSERSDAVRARQSPR